MLKLIFNSRYIYVVIGMIILNLVIDFFSTGEAATMAAQTITSTIIIAVILICGPLIYDYNILNKFKLKILYTFLMINTFSIIILILFYFIKTKELIYDPFNIGTSYLYSFITLLVLVLLKYYKFSKSIYFILAYVLTIPYGLNGFFKFPYVFQRVYDTVLIEYSISTVLYYLIIYILLLVLIYYSHCRMRRGK